MTAIDILPETTSEQLARTIVLGAEDKKGEDILLLKVTETCYLTDYFVIVTGFSKAQLRAIADSIEAKVKEEWGKEPLRVEGKAEASWIVQDYGDVIVHIFLPQAREFYHLEGFWGHAERIELPREEK